MTQETKQRTNTVSEAKAAYHAHLTAMNPGQTNESTYRASGAYYRAEILPLLPTDKHAAILDVGSGFGHLVRFVIEQGFTRVGGVELDAGLHQASVKYIGSRAVFLTHADGLSFLASHPAEYDLIIATDVIEHFPLDDAAQFAKQVRHALKPGGRAIFRTPNMANIFGIYSRYMDLTHQTGFTGHSLMQLLRVAGFSSAAVYVPNWDASGHYHAWQFRLSNWIQRKLFTLQDRTPPQSFDKNIVVWADVATIVSVSK